MCLNIKRKYVDNATLFYMKRIVLTGGGSGGHFYPLIAVSEELQRYNTADFPIEFYYMGPEPYNAEALQKNGIRYVHVPSGKKRKYFSIANLFAPFKLLWGTFITLQKLYVIYPDVVFSKGSYTSVPVVLAAAFLRIPIVIHESDTKAGSANKLAARFARYVAIAFDDVAQFFPPEKTALVGIPLRKEFTSEVPNAAEQLGVPNDKPILFVTGGSLGAERINNLIIESLDELLPNYTILHQTGESHEEAVRQSSASLIQDTNLLARYFVRGNLSATEMNLAQSAASLIISRAGAGTIFEIAVKKKPSIIIPIPESVSHDQRTNAYAYARTGAGVVLEQDNLSDGLLTAEITRIMSDQGLYGQMSAAAAAFASTNAANTLAQTLIAIMQEHA